MTQKERRILELEAIIGGFNKVINDMESDAGLDHILDNLRGGRYVYEEELRQLRTNLYLVRTVNEYGDEDKYLGVFRAESVNEALKFAADYHDKPEIANGYPDYCVVSVTHEDLSFTKKRLMEQLQLSTMVLN